MKKWLGLLLTVLLAMGVVLAAGCQTADDTNGEVQDVYLAIGGGPSGGMFNFVAAALEEVLGPQLEGIILSAEGTGGGGENLEWTNSGELDLGVTDGLSMYQAYHGIGKYDGSPKSNIRAVGLLVVGTTHFMTLEGSGINSLEDLVGKMLAVGTPGSSTALIAEELLTAMGIWDQINKEYLLGGTAIDALKDGHVDAFTWNAPHPTGAIVDLAATHNTLLLDTLTPAITSGFMDKHPYVWEGVVQAGTYDNAQDVPVINLAIALIANAEVDEEAVYKFTKAAYQSTEALAAAYGPLRFMTPENALKGIAIPLHPGAQRAFEELGLEIPEAIRAR